VNHLSRLSICEFTTPALTFEDDLQLYRSVGAAGIAICEQKLNAEIESAQLAAFRDSGLKASVCIPVNIGVLPCDPIFPGPEDPEERIKAMCESIRRLARFEPDRIVVVTGSPRGEDRAREIVIEGLRVAAATAAAEGVRLSLEPLRTDGGLDLTIVSTIPETLALLAETGASNIDIAYDVYHLWDTPNVEPLTRKHARRVGGVHI
jgi:sugar phosphate isomerase/epimerase